MTTKRAALDKDLKALFSALRTRAMPDRIRSLVDQMPPTPLKPKR